MQFWENLAKLYVGAPPRGNPGSATVLRWFLACPVDSMIQVHVTIPGEADATCELDISSGSFASSSGKAGEAVSTLSPSALIFCKINKVFL